MKINVHHTNYGMLLLKICIAVILLVHGLAGAFNGGINGFGQYLNSQGAAPFGVFLAWFIKLSHVLTAVCILMRKWLVWTCLLTIVVFIMGIFMVHLPNGWFVVGGGTNGVEFNLLLICTLLAFIAEKQPSVELKENKN